LWWRIGRPTSIIAVVISLAIHVATFFTLITPFSLLAVIPFLIIGGSSLNALWSRRRFFPSIKSWLLTASLLAYFAFHFVLVYRATGGATGTGIENGHYVYTYKTRVIRAITDEEYQSWPNLITRLMSVWIATMACFQAIQFTRQLDDAPPKS
jgi:hypothetical protein